MVWCFLYYHQYCFYMVIFAELSLRYLALLYCTLILVSLFLALNNFLSILTTVVSHSSYFYFILPSASILGFPNFFPKIAFESCSVFPCCTYDKEVTEFFFCELWSLLKRLRSFLFFYFSFFRVGMVFISPNFFWLNVGL